LLAQTAEINHWQALRRQWVHREPISLRPLASVPGLTARLLLAPGLLSVHPGLDGYRARYS